MDRDLCSYSHFAGGYHLDRAMEKERKRERREHRLWCVYHGRIALFAAYWLLVTGNWSYSFLLVLVFWTFTRAHTQRV